MGNCSNHHAIVISQHSEEDTDFSPKWIAAEQKNVRNAARSPNIEALAYQYLFK